MKPVQRNHLTTPGDLLWRCWHSVTAHHADANMGSRLSFVILALLLLGGRTGWAAEGTASPGPKVPGGVAEKWNALGAGGRPKDAEVPSQLTVNHEAHRIAYNFQAPGIAVVPLPEGRIRIWLSWYQQTDKPGGAAIGGGSISDAVYACCDDPFAKKEPAWTQLLRAEPVAKIGDETASDPEVALMPDGRLLCSYITSNHSRDRKRCTYAFLIANPAATDGTFSLGRQHWLEYGVLSQPFQKDGGAYAVIDEWGVARRFCRLEFS